MKAKTIGVICGGGILLIAGGGYLYLHNQEEKAKQEIIANLSSDKPFCIQGAKARYQTIDFHMGKVYIDNLS